MLPRGPYAIDLTWPNRPRKCVLEYADNRSAGVCPQFRLMEDRALDQTWQLLLTDRKWRV